MAATPDCYQVAWGRAIEPTARRLGKSAEAAAQYALETVQTLRAPDFVSSVEQRGSWFDVYALYRDGYGWYVKIGEDDDGLLLISHHEPEHGSITTASGNVVAATEPDDQKDASKHGGKK